MPSLSDSFPLWNTGKAIFGKTFYFLSCILLYCKKYLMCPLLQHCKVVFLVHSLTIPRNRLLFECRLHPPVKLNLINYYDYKDKLLLLLLWKDKLITRIRESDNEWPHIQ